MFNKNNDKYRSAIKEKPLRRAGQSIEEKLESIFDDQLLLYVLGTGLSLGCILIGWVIVLLPFTIKDAVILTIIGFVVEIICIRKILKVKTEVINYREGLRGERFMGDHLDTLREKGCKVYHDFVIKDKDSDGRIQIRNIDHIVISSKGIFTIETKTMRKPNDKDETLTYDGKKLYFKSTGKEVPTLPFKQANGEARDIRNFIKTNTGEDFEVQPIVVYPGWFVKPSTNLNNKGKHDVWVCNHNFLDGLINDGRDKLTSQQVTVVSNKLSDYIRNYERKK